MTIYMETNVIINLSF